MGDIQALANLGIGGLALAAIILLITGFQRVMGQVVKMHSDALDAMHRQSRATENLTLAVEGSTEENRKFRKQMAELAETRHEEVLSILRRGFSANGTPSDHEPLHTDDDE